MVDAWEDGPSTILVAIDGSETALRAGAYAAGMARRQHSRLACLYVRAVSGLAAAAPGAVSAIRATQDTLSAELRDAVEKESARIGLDTVFIERQGNPFTELVRLAEELQVDAVVVGASTKAGHRFVGSLAVHLVRIAHWPVTVVP
ncbi:MAG: universal stress protein [Pseudonocardiaceae bacterium]